MLGNFWNSQKQSSTTKSQSCFCPPVCTCQPFFFIGWKLVGLGADFAHTAMPETFGRVGQSISPRSALYCFLGSLANFARPSLPISNLWKEVLNIARISEAILWSRIAIYCVYIYIFIWNYIVTNWIVWAIFIIYCDCCECKLFEMIKFQERHVHRPAHDRSMTATTSPRPSVLHSKALGKAIT